MTSCSLAIALTHGPYNDFGASPANLLSPKAKEGSAGAGASSAARRDGSGHFITANTISVTAPIPRTTVMAMSQRWPFDEIGASLPPST
jgi:hypothetical protein